MLLIFEKNYKRNKSDSQTFKFKLFMTTLSDLCFENWTLQPHQKPCIDLAKRS